MNNRSINQFKVLFERYNQERIIWEILLDSKRTNAYINFIKDNVKDKIVIECGTGTGFFSWLSIKYGAKKVYSCEQSSVLSEKLQERFKDIDNLEVINLDVFTDKLPAGDIYIHELFGHGALSEGITYFLKNCRLQNIENIYPNNLKLVSCNLNDLTQTPVSLEDFDNSDLDKDLIKFLKINNKQIDPKNKLFNNNYSITESNLIFNGNIFDLLNFENIINRNYLYTYFEAGFDNNYYSSFEKHQNHWEIRHQTTYSYIEDNRRLIKNKEPY